MKTQERGPDEAVGAPPSPEGERPGWVSRHRRWLPLLAGLLGAGVFLNTLPNDFVLDDHMAVRQNAAAHPPIDLEKLEKIFGTNFWGSPPDYEHLTIYRPLATLTFALGEALHGPAPWGHHLVNALLHGLLSGLVVLLGLALLRCPLAALAAGLLFAVHPIHAEAVAGVVSRAEILAAVFVVATLLLAERAHRCSSRARRRRAWLAAGLCFSLGLLSKENAATALLMLPLLDAARFLRARRDGVTPGRPVVAWPLLVACGVVLGGYLALRAAVLPAVLGGDVPLLDNPIVEATGPGRWLTPFTVYATGWRLLVWPFGLSVDYTAHAIPLATAWSEPAALLGLALFLATLGLALRWLRRHPVRSLAIGLYLAAWSVVSHLAFPGTVIFAERLLYLPSVGLSLLAGLGFAWAAHPARPRPLPLAATALGAAALLVLAGATIVRNAEWRDELTLYERSAERTPASSRLQNNLGRRYMLARDLRRAVPCFQEAARIAPENFSAWSNLGDAAIAAGRLGPARAALLEALRLAPGHVPALNNLCYLERVGGRPAAGLDACRLAARRAPGRKVVRLNLVRSLWAAGLRSDARAELERVRPLFPGDPELAALVREVQGPPASGDRSPAPPRPAP